MTWLSFTLGFVLGLVTVVWFVWQWWSREDAEQFERKIVEDKLQSAVMLIESQDELITALQAKVAEREKTPSNVHHLPVYRTAASLTEPDKVYCKDCLWYEQYAFDRDNSCAKGPQIESPIFGLIRKRRSARASNAAFDCSDFEKGNPFEATSLEKRRQAGVR